MLSLIRSCALLSQQVYQEEDKARESTADLGAHWKCILSESAEDRPPREKSKSWSLSSSISSVDTPQSAYWAAYHNASQEQVIIAFKGTQIRHQRDLENDFDIFQGKRPRALPQALAFVETVIAYLNKQGIQAEIILTGHSLGGTLAEYIALEKGYKTLTFESPGIFLNTALNRHEAQITHYLMLPNVINTVGSHVGKIQLLPDVGTPQSAQASLLRSAVTALLPSETLLAQGLVAMVQFGYGYFAHAELPQGIRDGLTSALEQGIHVSSSPLSTRLKDGISRHSMNAVLHSLNSSEDATRGVITCTAWPTIVEYLAPQFAEEAWVAQQTQATEAAAMAL